MVLRWFLVATCCLVAALPAPAEENAKATYADLLERVKKADPKANFLQLRLAFTETADYNPYNSNRDEQRAMAAALGVKEFDKALGLAEKVLAQRYVDIAAHLVAHRAHKGLGREDRAEFHQRVADGLVQSILKSGDGKSPATAYVVISTDEEYAVLAKLNIRVTRQALTGEKDQKFDRMEGTTADGPVTLYFNITRPFRWLEGQLRKGK